MRECIINYSEGHWYPRGQARLVKSLASIKYAGDILLFDESMIKGCPTHKESPYAFKYWIFDYARKKGYDYVLWLDSSFWVIKSLAPLFNRIATTGYVLQMSDGYELGSWCSDIALKILGYSREKSLSMIMPDGGLIGLHMHNERALNFLQQMIKYSQNKDLFSGSWTNDKQQVSKDKRVLGHRHDMSIGCMVANKLDMKAVSKGVYWVQADQHVNYPDICLLGQGM